MKEVSADELRSRTRWRKQPFLDRSTSHWDRSSTG